MSCYIKYLEQITAENDTAEFQSQITEPVSETEIEHIAKFMREHIHEQDFFNEGRSSFLKLVNGYCDQQSIIYPDKTNRLVKAIETVTTMMLNADDIFLALTPEKLAKVVSLDSFVFKDSYPLSSFVEDLQFAFNIELKMITVCVTTVLDTRVLAVAIGRDEIDRWVRQIGLHVVCDSWRKKGIEQSFGSSKLVGEWKKDDEGDYIHLKFIFPDTSYWGYYIYV